MGNIYEKTKESMRPQAFKIRSMRRVLDMNFFSINKDEKFTLTEGRFELYIDQRYVGKKLCSINGAVVNSIGLLPYKYYKKREGTKPDEEGTFMCPHMTDFFPTSINMGEKVKIYEESDEKEYTVLTFFPGDEICSIYVIQSLDNVVIMTDAVLNGKLDNNIPYKLLTKAWVLNSTQNAVNFNVPITTLEVIISELCRDKKNQNRKFAEVLGKDPTASQVGYVFANIRDICAASSVYAALSFEDQNAMLDASLNMTKEQREQKISPLEQLLKL